ncbi:MAG: metallopeptidase TldD-related protein [Jatrophihabitans sp.]
MRTPQELVESALAASGADGCIVVVAEHTETNLRWAANALTTNGQMQTRSMTVVSTFEHDGGTSAGVVTRSISTADEVTDLVRASERAGRDAEPADDAAPLVAPYDHDDDWEAPPAATSVAVFEGFAADLGGVLRDWQDADRRLYGFAEHQLTSSFLGVSTGLRRRVDQPSGRLELNGKTADGTGSTWSGRYTRDFRDIEASTETEALGRQLDWQQRRIELPPGRYETIVPPTCVADLLIYAYWTASARDAEEGRNVFASGSDGTRVGEQLSSLPLTLRSDPHAPGLECAPFDVVTASHAGMQSVFDNGQPVDPTDWVRDGRLADLIRTRAWAQRTGARPRPVVDNLILEADGATATLEQMIASTERGLLMTSLWYLREVDPQTLLLTGLTRDGVFLIEDGKVQGQVNNFRFNESPVDLLSRITEVGATVPTLPREWADYFRRTAMPPIRVPDFNMSTVSTAS